MLLPGRNWVKASSDMRFLLAGLDGDGNPAVWFETDPTGKQAEPDVEVIATGDPVPEGHRHIGMFSPEPGLVFHAYVREAWVR